MTAAAEHALRTLGEKLEEAANSPRLDTRGHEILKAMADAHVATADQLQAEREEREGKLNENQGGFSYNPKGKAKDG